MKVNKITSIFLTICLLFGTIPFSFSASATETLEIVDGEDNIEELANAKSLDDLVAGEDYVENEIIVCCKEQEDSTEIIPKIFDDYDLSVDYCLSDVSDDVSDSKDTTTYLMSMDNLSTNIANLIEDLEKDPDIVYAQPNYIYNTCEETNGNVSSVNSAKIKSYNNSQLSMFQSLSTDKTDEWWSSTGGEGVKIAVIDSGIDLDHPALSGCLWNENGIYGYNTTDPENVTAITISNCDDFATDHGTHVAGIIGMHSDVSGEYTCKGIAPGAQIIDLQATNDSSGTFETVSLIAAMEMAVELGADVVNLSLGGQYYDYAWNLVCNRAARSLVIVAAAGNDGFNEASLKNYPAAFSSVIGVMAYGGKKDYIDDTDSATNYVANNYPSTGYQEIASFSNYDFNMRCYDIVAPGVNVCSANAGGIGNITGYCFESGTSMASPVVSAAAALYLEKNPSATPAQVRAALRTTGGREIISGKYKSIPNKLDVDKLLETKLDRTVDRSYANADAEGYSKLCELIKINLGYKAKEDITITNDDLTLISNLKIDSYESIGDSLDKLDELSRLISLTISGYDFNNTRINTLFNENQFEHLETLEICDTAVYKINLNGEISSVLTELRAHDNVNLSYLTSTNYFNVNSYYLEDNNISDLSFLKGLNINTYENISNWFTRLYLSGNKIKDLTPLTELNYVHSLYLSDNCVEDYTPILNIKGLSFVDLSENYLGDSENKIEDLLNGDTEHPIFVYKPFKDNFVEINNVKLNDFSVKRTDVDYIPKVIVSPSNATYLNNTSLTGPENDIVTVDRYTGQINYNPNYLFDTTDNEFTTAINYSNSGVSGTSQISLLMPIISELNYEKYSYDTGINRNQITMLTTTDTTRIKVVQTYTENGEVKGTPVEKNVINDCEYIDYGDNRIITFNYDNAITADSTVTVYAGDSIGYFSSEVINSTNTIEISVENCNITGISGSSQFLNIIDDVNITGIESNAIGNSCNIENLYFPENIYSLSNNSFNSSSVKNAVFYRLDGFEVAADAFGICNGNFKVYTNDEDSELAEESVSAGVDCITDYEFDENTLLKYKGRATSIVLPECLKITTIGPFAFKNNRSLKTIDLGKAIYAINDSAFYGCGKLENVINAERVKRIGNGAFRSTSITNIDVSNAEVIGSYAFGNCTNILNIMIIGDTAKDTFILNDNAFYGCKNLKNISYKGTLELGSKTFGECNALTEIFSEDVELKGTEAFSGCTALKKVVLSETSNIPEKSFDGCSSLEKVKIKNIKTLEIEGYAFRGTESLKELGLLSEKIYFDTNSFVGASNELAVYCNSDAIKSARPHVSICTDFQTIIWNNKIILDKYLGNSENVVIPECLEIYEIGGGAFSLNQLMRTIEIPSNTQEIGFMAFAVCRNLSQIYNGKNVKIINALAFSSCTNLRGISSLCSIQKICSYAFSSIGIKNYIMPNSVFECHDSVFNNCTDLTEIIISSNIKYINRNTFNGCIRLDRCILNSNIKTIYMNAFKGCTSLEQIYIPDSIERIDITSFESETALYSSNNAPIALGTIIYTENDIVKNNLNIGNAIYPNYKIINGVLKEYQSETGYDYIDDAGKKVIDVPNVVEEIRSSEAYFGGVFKDNREAQTYILPKYLKVIDQNSFYNSWANKIIMPNNMQYIGANAFNKCTSLKEITIPDGLETIETNTFFQTRCIGYKIPDSVTEIKSGAFWHCDLLKSVYIPDTVTNIATNAFADCNDNLVIYGHDSSYLNEYVQNNSNKNGNNNLVYKSGYNVNGNIFTSYDGNEEAVQIPYGIGLSRIADEAFKNNAFVKSVSIASGITHIGENCFENCTSLTAVVIPNDVESIGDNVFNGVSGVTVYCNSGSFAEDYCIKNNITVVTDYDVSDGVLNKYNGSETNVVIPDNLCLVEIGRSSFYNINNIQSIIIPEGVTVLGINAIYRCNNLTTVTLPTTIQKLNFFAICYNPMLTVVNNSEFIKDIDSYAFSGCNSLNTLNLSGVKKLSYNVFNNCDSLTSVTIGREATSVDHRAFNNCDNVSIYCYENSYIHQFAINNNISYILLNPDETNESESDDTNMVLKSKVNVSENNRLGKTADEFFESYIVNECHGDVNDENIGQIINYMVLNGWWL